MFSYDFTYVFKAETGDCQIEAGSLPEAIDCLIDVLWAEMAKTDFETTRAEVEPLLFSITYVRHDRSKS